MGIKLVVAFCIKTGDVLYGNGMRFVSKWKAFRYKTQGTIGMSLVFYPYFYPVKSCICFLDVVPLHAETTLII